jgi:hypothetical protein
MAQLNEEPKQETIEEAAEIFYSEQSKSYEDAIEPIFDNSRYLVAGFIDGAKWQQERMYSKADMISFAHFYFTEEFNSNMQTSKSTEEIFEDWMEQSLNK